MPESLIIVAIVGGLLIAFPLFWMGVGWLLARLGGWSNMAAQYPAVQPPVGDRHRWRSGRLSLLGSYSSILNVTVSATGVHLQPMVLYHIGHPAVFLPWQAVTSFERARGPFSAVRMELRSVDGRRPVKIWLNGRALVESLRRHHPTDFSAP